MGVAVRAALVAVTLAVSAACNNGPLELANIQVGRSLNQDRSVGSTIPTVLLRPVASAVATWDAE